MNRDNWPIFIFVGALLILLLGFLGLTFYEEHLEAYNTQQDRILFQKTHDAVIRCRATYAVNNVSADKICGTLPTFYNKVS